MAFLPYANANEPSNERFFHKPVNKKMITDDANSFPFMPRLILCINSHKWLPVWVTTTCINCYFSRKSNAVILVGVAVYLLRVRAQPHLMAKMVDAKNNRFELRFILLSYIVLIICILIG